jgi:carboxyl-terminal processing protease
MRTTSFLGLVFLLSLTVACKKSKDGGGSTNPVVRDKVKDTAVDIARDIYLWYEQIPAGFDAQAYADPDKIMTAIRQYSKEPGFSNPVDRWSFAYKQADWDNVSSGVAKDFGLSVFFKEEGDLRVKYVEKNSPAFIAGVRRGWRITKLNGSTNITTGNANFIIDAVFNSNATSFTFLKPDASAVDLSLNSATYQSDPFLLDTTYNIGANRVGYIVFNSFLGDTTAIYNKLETIFNGYATKGINDVIVDLRYNGGGYVSVQSKFANYLVPSGSTGAVMMNQQFNNKYSSFNSTGRFSKLGTINLPRVFFIVSNNTASASELLINNLKPFMTVKIVGPSSTYGKPVGYFPIPVGDWYVFPVSFRSTNKNSEGNYFNGFAPDKTTADGLDKDWGNTTEDCLASVLKYIGTGTFGVMSEVPGRANIEKINRVNDANSSIESRRFKGAVETRRL